MFNTELKLVQEPSCETLLVYKTMIGLCIDMSVLQSKVKVYKK